MPRTREQDAIYQRERRACKRREAQQAQGSAAGSTADATGKPIGVQDVDLAAALAEPEADDRDAIILSVLLDDGHFAKLARLMRALEAHHGSRVKVPAAVRVAIEVAARVLAGGGAPESPSAATGAAQALRSPSGPCAPAPLPIGQHGANLMLVRAPARVMSRTSPGASPGLRRAVVFGLNSLPATGTGRSSCVE